MITGGGGILPDPAKLAGISASPYFLYGYKNIVIYTGI